MNDRNDVRHVAGWLTDLANLTAGSAPLADSKTKIAALALILAGDYPGIAFNRHSLSAVARQCRFFPSYAELCEHLGAWWRDHRPTPVAIASPLSDTWSQRVEADHAQAASDWKDPAIVRASVRSLIDHPRRMELGHMLGSLIGRHAPENLAFLPAEWQEASPERARGGMSESPKARHLTPEQLAPMKSARPAA